MDWYLLPVNPEPWAVGPIGTGRRGGKVWAYMGRNEGLHAYQEAVRESVVNPKKLEGDLHIIFFFWRQVVAKERAHEADVTNMQKATEDALQGILYDNDRNVRQVTSVLVGQGPDVDGKVAVGIGPYGAPKIPDPILLLLMQYEADRLSPAEPSDNTYDEVSDLF